MGNITVLVWWRNLLYIQHRLNFSLRQHRLTEFNDTRANIGRDRYHSWTSIMSHNPFHLLHFCIRVGVFAVCHIGVSKSKLWRQIMEVVMIIKMIIVSVIYYYYYYYHM